MFVRKSAESRVRRVPSKQEGALIESLKADVCENAYLLGLLADYGLRGLKQMGWGNFYWVDEEPRPILYQDVTGLVVLNQVPMETLEDFAIFLENSKIKTTRIISREETVLGLRRILESRSDRWKDIRTEFPEVGMILEKEFLANYAEKGLFVADPTHVRDIAQGSALAMAEEIGVETTPKDFDRLVRSKTDLVERNRYFLLEDAGEIVFQAYLSAVTPEVGQIQGVWVPPQYRNRGVATRCLAEMCRRCFDYCECFVLRVQVRNIPARAAYEKVGFKDFLKYRSVWFT